MTAPLRHPLGEPTHVDITDFAEMCRDYVMWWHDGIIAKTDAVGCVQRHAELWGVVDEIGQDEVQRLMAADFASAEAIKANPHKSNRAIAAETGISLGTVNAARKSGEQECSPERVGRDGKSYPTDRAYRTPQATVDAFFYVVRNEPSRLRAWLLDHPREAAYLHKLWKEEHAVA